MLAVLLGLGAVAVLPAAPAAAADRNFARRHFLGSPGRGYRFGDASSKEYGRFLAAELRRAHARYPHDATLTALVDELRSQSACFEQLWAAGDVTEPQHIPKQLVHGTAGVVRVRCDVLVVAEHDLRVVLFTAKPRTRSARAIRALAASVPAEQRVTRSA